MRHPSSPTWLSCPSMCLLSPSFSSASSSSRTPGENSPISTNSFTWVRPTCPRLGLKRRPTEMARGYEPEEFIGPREVSEERESKAQQTSCNEESRDQVREEPAQGAGSHTDPGAICSPELRQVYEIRGRTYRLRTSEITTMVEVGKFRTIAQEDLTEFAYGSDKGRMRPDVENLIRQGLVQMKSIPHEEKGSRQLLTLTKSGHRFLTENRIAARNQALYFGFAKPREAHHDADLYRLYHELAKLGPDRASAESKRTVAERQGLQVVRGKIPLPDVRIEYDTPDGERARVNIELATSHYRGRHLAEKVRAGFSIYAHSSDLSNLRRVLDQRELTAEILSL